MNENLAWVRNVWLLSLIGIYGLLFVALLAFAPKQSQSLESKEARVNRAYAQAWTMTKLPVSSTFNKAFAVRADANIGRPQLSSLRSEAVVGNSEEKSRAR